MGRNVRRSAFISLLREGGACAGSCVRADSIFSRSVSTRRSRASYALLTFETQLAARLGDVIVDLLGAIVRINLADEWLVITLLFEESDPNRWNNA